VVQQFSLQLLSPLIARPYFHFRDNLASAVPGFLRGIRNFSIEDCITWRDLQMSEQTADTHICPSCAWDLEAARLNALADAVIVGSAY
jgi:hypothetical protein